MDPHLPKLMFLDDFLLENEAASSFQFFEDLRRAQELSLKTSSNNNDISKNEIEMIRQAQLFSLQEQKERNKAMERLQRRLECPWNMEISDQTDDQGNCQFDSAADQLHRYPDTKHITHQQVRAQVVQWLQQNPDYRLSSDADDEENGETLESWVKATQQLSWSEYCSKMSKDKQWGDEITMKAITETFQCRIFLFSSTVSEQNYFSEHLPKSYQKQQKQQPQQRPLFESMLPSQQAANESTTTQQQQQQQPLKTLVLCHVLEVHYGSLHLRQKQQQQQQHQPTSSSNLVDGTALSDEHKKTLLKTLFGSNANLSESIVEFVASAQRNHMSMAVNTLIDLSNKLGKQQQKPQEQVSRTPPPPQHPLQSADPGERSSSPSPVSSSSDELIRDFVVLDKDVTVTDQSQPAHIEVKKVALYDRMQTCLAVYFECVDGEQRPTDWLSLAPVDSRPRDYYTYWKTGGTAQGIVSFVCPPSLWGQYEFRWMRDNYAVLGRSQPVSLGPSITLDCSLLPTVTTTTTPTEEGQQKDETAAAAAAAAAAVGPAKLLVKVVNQGDLGSCTAWDWVGLFPTGEKRSHRYLQSSYVNQHTMDCVLSVPSAISSFEVRFFSGLSSSTKSHSKYQPLASIAVYVNEQGKLVHVPIKN